MYTAQTTYYSIPELLDEEFDELFQAKTLEQIEEYEEEIHNLVDVLELI